MAITCRDICELDICSRLKLLGGEQGLDNVVTWPYIKNMDTISEWIHGGELIFVIGAKEDISERGLLNLMEEAVNSKISGVVLLFGEDYIKSIPKSVVRYANEKGLPLFKIPFMLKLIDITQEISRIIVKDRELNKERGTYVDTNILELLIEGKKKEIILNYCWSKLQPLIEADRVLKTEYVYTLKNYLYNNNDLLNTSKKMYIHRNTMINRMKKITNLLKININEAKNRTEYYNIYKYLEYYEEI